MIDTLMYVKRLEASGVPREQAELQVQIMADIVDKNYATKQDLKDQTAELRLEIKEATITYGKMLVGAAGFIVAAIGFMLKFNT